MRILVIGSNSFSGASLINYLLNKNHKIIGFSRRKEINKLFLPYKNNKNLKNFQFFQIDLNKNLTTALKVIKKLRPSVIVDFSAQGMVSESWNNPDHWYKTNLLSKVKLVESLKRFKFIKKFINFSTPEIYGSSKRSFKENQSINPSTPYALSKAAFDLHLLNMFKNFKFPAIITRAANVHGKHQQLYRIIPRTIMYIKLNKKLILEGGGKSFRSFIHIDDVSRALYKIIMQGKSGEIFHISTKKMTSIRNIVKIICKIMNVNYKKFVKEIKKDRIGKDKNYQISSYKLRKNFHWNEKISLDQGIEATIHWIEKNFNKLKKQSLNYKHIV